jgi:hypothetical protein
MTQRDAIDRPGEPRTVASLHARVGSPLDAAILIGAVACTAVAAWLFVVAATVVPERDPSRVGFWNAVALGFIAYAVVTALYIVGSGSGRWRIMTSVAVLASLIALVAGAGLAIPMLLTSGDFEGYIVLMGVVLAGQGALVLTHAVRGS